MITTAVLINASFLIMLSFMHIYWAIGGKAGMSAVLPDVFYQQRKHLTAWRIQLLIGGFMGLCALIITGNLHLFSPYVPQRIFMYGTIIVGVLFLLRALGDYHYMGFFKKANGTLFSKNDTLYYSPVSLVISLLCFAIAYFN